MFDKLDVYIRNVISNFGSIPPERKDRLKELADYIQQKTEHSKSAKLNFICTHNSRRSHLAQIWTSTAAYYYEIEGVECYSGGTEATAFNPRAVAALERAGFQIQKTGEDNPDYHVHFTDKSKPIICFSKKFDHEVNPDRSFAAVMTCSDADENCPLVPGADFRIPITYKDPKESDGTNQEEDIYDERCFQIATEMFYMMDKASNG